MADWQNTSAETQAAELKAARAIIPIVLEQAVGVATVGAIKRVLREKLDLSPELLADMEDNLTQVAVAVMLACCPEPRRHRFWRPGEADCPRDIKAGNGELHTLRCKVCGQDDPRDDRCLTPIAQEGV